MLFLQPKPTPRVLEGNREPHPGSSLGWGQGQVEGRGGCGGVPMRKPKWRWGERNNRSIIILPEGQAFSSVWQIKRGEIMLALQNGA